MGGAVENGGGDEDTLETIVARGLTGAAIDGAPGGQRPGIKSGATTVPYPPSPASTCSCPATSAATRACTAATASTAPP